MTQKNEIAVLREKFVELCTIVSGLADSSQSSSPASFNRLLDSIILAILALVLIVIGALCPFYILILVILSSTLLLDYKLQQL